MASAAPRRPDASDGGWRLDASDVERVVAAVGLRQLLHALRGEVHDLVAPARLPPGRRRAADVVGRAGHLGRTVTFGLVGGFLVRAAWRVDPDHGVGLDAALQELTGAPYGRPVLIATALCLVAFGLHRFLETVWADR